jgi:hypothetical protein
MNTTNTTAAPRLVAATRKEQVDALLSDCMSALYHARGLAAGATLLAARAIVPTRDDKQLRRQAAEIAANAVERLQKASRRADEARVSPEPASALEPIFGLLEGAEGRLKVAIDLLDAMDCRDEDDDTLHALDLHGMALAKLLEAGRCAMGASEALRVQAAA